MFLSFSMAFFTLALGDARLKLLLLVHLLYVLAEKYTPSFVVARNLRLVPPSPFAISRQPSFLNETRVLASSFISPGLVSDRNLPF